MLRKIFFWLHLSAGVTVGAVVLILSVTGVLLTYQRHIQEWADTRGKDGSAPVSGATSLPVAQLIERAQSARDGKPTAVRWRTGDDAPVEVVFGRDGSLFLNRYTGVALGGGADGVRKFFVGVTNWHRYLAREGETRDRGRLVTGIANLAFLFIICSGFYLWWPRNRTRTAFRSVMTFRTGLAAKARDFNWHNVIGFWSLVPLFIIITTGVVISYPKVNDFMYRAVGDTPPSAANNSPAAPRERGEKPRLALATVDPLVARAAQQYPGWRWLTMQLEPTREGAVAFNIDRALGGQPHKRALLQLDATTADVVKWEPFAAQTSGRRARAWVRYSHTGEIAGLAGQTIAGIVSLGVVVLIYTGISLALRRLFAWRRRRNTPRSAIRTTDSSQRMGKARTRL